MEIAQIHSLQVGAGVDGLKGTITEIKPVRAFRNGKGHTQVIEVADHTGRIQLKLWTRPAIPDSAKGTTVDVIPSATSKKPSISVTEDEYRGTVTRLLSVSESAYLQFQQTASAPSAPSTPAPAPYHPASAAVPTTSHQPSGQQPQQPQAGVYLGAPSDAVLIRKHIHRLGRLMIYCLREAAHVCDMMEQRYGIPLTESQKQGIGAALFIEANRKDLLRHVPDMEPPPPKSAPLPPSQQSEPPPEYTGESAGPSGECDDVPF